MEDFGINIIFLISSLLGLIQIFFLISIIRYHRRYMKLQKQQIHAEIRMQENERKRIASDLHDTLGPLLASVKLQINSIEPTEDEDIRIIDKASQYLDEIIGQVREISHNLLPNTLQRKGLTEALREFARNASQKEGLQIDFHLIHPVSLDPESETHLFRMIQEITYNTLKHAEARNLQIGLGKEGNEVLLLSKDDGAGFDMEKIRKTSAGLGLKNIESRVEILRGTYILKSEPGKGTSYFVKIPLQTDEDGIKNPDRNSG